LAWGSCETLGTAIVAAAHFGRPSKGNVMYLESLRIKNFRSCRDSTVHFLDGLTVLAGENNGGKSNILDAIRLVTAPASGRRNRYAEPTDILRGSGSEFTVEARFAGLSETLRGQFITALPEPTASSAVFGMRYEAPAAGSLRGTINFWAGKWQGADPEPNARNLVRHVYLPALRDAQRELASGRSGRVVFLLRHLAGEGQVEDFEEKAREAFTALEGHPLVSAATERVASGLRYLTAGLESQEACLGFARADLAHLARDLRFYLGQHGLDTAELAESGLGYANLLYLAAVLVELLAAKDADLTLFLVEEPEAHLHPQLQALTLGYLRDQAARVPAVSPDAFEGRIQVVVTTHSPHLTAAVGARHVVVVCRPPVLPRPAQAGAFSSTVAVPVDRLGLTNKTLGKIDRYLDVTRCSLLFARRVLLVEGMTEALLLPVLAERFVLCGEPQADALARFRATTLVPIGGVDFAPYLMLLLTAHDGCRLADRVVVVTDKDADDHRCDLLLELGACLGAVDRLRLHAATPTLEAELFAAGNEQLLGEVFLELHRRSAERWKRLLEEPENERPASFVSLLASTRTRKGDFAQALAARIVAGAAFTVPTYLSDAIESVVAEAA